MNITETPAASHRGKSPVTFNIRMNDGVCIYAAEGLDMGWEFSPGDRNLLDNPCGELVRLETRQLGIISKIPCATSCF